MQEKRSKATSLLFLMSKKGRKNTEIMNNFIWLKSLNTDESWAYQV